jgi:hypothetical protein
MSTLKKKPSQTEALAFALYLAVTASDTDRSQEALALAEKIASNMRPERVAAAKALAGERLVSLGLEKDSVVDLFNWVVWPRPSERYEGGAMCAPVQRSLKGDEQ